MGTVIGGVVATGNQNIDALIYGTRWDTASLVTYDFPDAFADYGAYSHTTSGFFLVPLQQRTAVRLIIEGADGIAGLITAGTVFTYGSFQSVTGLNVNSPGALNAADISVAGTNLFDGANLGTARVADFPRLDQRSDSGDVWFGNDYAEYLTPLPGDYAWLTHIHELGHSFGLKHGHDSSYGQFSLAMTANRDSLEYSVMTYRSYIGGPTTGYTNETYGFPQTLMMYDIAALQHLYGANFLTNNTNTIYTWSPTTGEMSINGVGQGAPGDGTAAGNRIFMTVWDGGGVDTYDLSAYSTGVSIDLEPGGSSTFLGTQRANLGGGNFARGNVYNALQYNNDPGSLIENATGGSGPDTLYGNSAANTLNGGPNNDYIYGFLGDDVYIVDNAGDFVYEYAAQGTDRVLAYASYTLAAGAEIELFRAMGASPINLTGNELAQTLSGNDASNVLDGQGGADVMRGFGGDDVMIVDNVNDLVFEAAGAGYDTVFANVSYSLAAGQEVESMAVAPVAYTSAISLAGNEFVQSLVGGSGDNVLNGRGGADFMFGLAGSDSYFVDNLNDMVFEAPSSGTDTVWASTSYALPAGQSIETLRIAPGAPAGVNLTGNELVQTIIGDGFANVIDSRGGADYIVSGAGADTIIFTLRGSAGVDGVSDFNPVLDTIGLENAVFTGLGAAGALPGPAFFIGAAATAASHRIIYNNATGMVFYDPDGLAGAAQEPLVVLTPGLAMTAADFVVI